MKTLCFAALTLGLAVQPAAAQAPAGETAALTQEVERLRAQEEIRHLLHEYGRTLDARDFGAFAGLFAADAVYVGGPGEPLTGPDAIAGFLETIIGDNPAGYAEPNFHIFFNEQITVLDESRATGTSMSAFAVPGADGAQLAILARYEDDYVRENGRWKFQRRVVHGLLAN